jgi:hypothetical protein
MLRVESIDQVEVNKRSCRYGATGVRCQMPDVSHQTLRNRSRSGLDLLLSAGHYVQEARSV